MELEFVTANWHLFLALIIITFLLVYDSTQGASGAKGISAMQVPQLISHQSAIIIDVCETEEYTKGHIEKSINLPLSVLKDKVKTIIKYRDKPVVLTCHSGNRAGRAASILKKNEFNDLYILNGGMISWRKENLPVVKS